MNLGNIYSAAIRGDLENQELAIQLYEAALQLLEKKNKRDWGLTEMNLGNVYFERGRGNPVPNLISAIQAYEKALEVFKKDTEPRLWAQLQMNLGNVYSVRRLQTRKKEFGPLSRPWRSSNPTNIPYSGRKRRPTWRRPIRAACPIPLRTILRKPSKITETS